MGFKTRARKWRNALSVMSRKPFEVVKSLIDREDIVPCAAKSLLDSNKVAKDAAYSESVVQAALGSAYLGLLSF